MFHCVSSNFRSLGAAQECALTLQRDTTPSKGPALCFTPFVLHNLCSIADLTIHIVGDRPRLYQSNLDQVFDDWNMAAIVSLLNFLDQKMVWLV